MAASPGSPWRHNTAAGCVHTLLRCGKRAATRVLCSAGALWRGAGHGREEAASPPLGPVSRLCPLLATLNTYVVLGVGGPCAPCCQPLGGCVRRLGVWSPRREGAPICVRGGDTPAPCFAGGTAGTAHASGRRSEEHDPLGSVAGGAALRFSGAYFQ